MLISSLGLYWRVRDQKCKIPCESGSLPGTDNVERWKSREEFNKRIIYQRVKGAIKEGTASWNWQQQGTATTPELEEERDYEAPEGHQRGDLIWVLF